MPHRADLEYLARVSAYSCQYDPRFSYFVYVPKNWLEPTRPERYHLTVVIHGTERSAENYRNKLRDYAENTNSIILAPLFPAGLIEPRRMENYNLLRFHDVEFDVILLHMVNELGERFPINIDDGFCLHGFSAGGQFVHRFFYLYPQHLRAVSVGAPGQVTLLDYDRPWPLGLDGIDRVFGLNPSVENMKQVPVQIVVGSEDTYIQNPSEQEMNRLELNQMLFNNMKSLGLDVSFDLQPEAGHNGFKVLPLVISFFKKILEIKPKQDIDEEEMRN